jgi:hypothetical protein
MVGEDSIAVPAKLRCFHVWPVLVPHFKSEKLFYQVTIMMEEDILEVDQNGMWHWRYISPSLWIMVQQSTVQISEVMV